MIEKQQKTLKDITMPETVYRRAIWAIKDLPRMEERIRELENGYILSPDYSRIKSSGGKISDQTSTSAILLAELKTSRDKIYDGLGLIPEKYREGIYERIVFDKAYSDEYHINTWKKWQHVAIYFVARKMNMI